MPRFSPTAAERQRERFAAGNLRSAAAALRNDGFVIIEDVVDPARLDALRAGMEADLARILQQPRLPHNFVWGNLQQDPPPFADYIFRDVVANPFVCQVTRQVLGEGAFNKSMTGNTNLPDSQLQPVHVDDGQLWPNLEVAHPPARLVVNVPLVDTSAENGAIELWPATHLDTRQVIGRNIRVPEEAVEARRAISPPVRPPTRKGAVLIRDMRLWHRGTPNASDAPRFMIAMIHTVAWYDRTCRIDLDERCAPVFAGCPIDNAIPLVDRPGDHLVRLRAYDYDGPN
mgnify:CR=1 FL=1